MPSTTSKSTTNSSSSSPEPVKKHHRCEATTATGKRCSKSAVEDSAYCTLHKRSGSASSPTPASSSQKRRRSTSRSAPIKRNRRSLAKDPSDIEYPIEKLVEKQVFYRVRWAGYSPNDDTWEREEKLPRKSILLFEKEEEKRRLREETRQEDKGQVSESDQEDEESTHHRQGSQELESEPEIELEESPTTPSSKRRKI